MNFDINQAVKFLQAGELVAFPTETVYGLGADAKNPDALRKIFAAKGRPIDHPVIVHIARLEEIGEWARDIPDMAYKLAEKCWPGPLTLILNKAPNVHDYVTGGQDTIGIRIPNHPVALTLLKEFGSGLAAPSANKFGRISPTTKAAVQDELGDAVSCILEGGNCDVGIESTILDLSTEIPVILRPGMLLKSDIEKILNASVASKSNRIIRVSGSLESHYAPKTPTILTHDLSILAPEDAVILLEERELKAYSVVLSNNPKVYAREIYRTLRMLDNKGFKRIAIEDLPEGLEWAGIRDRLVRAST